MSIDFMNPAGFLLLLLIPLIFAFRKIKLFSKITLPLTFSDYEGWVFTWSSKFRTVCVVAVEVLFVLGVISLVVAFCEPVVHQSKRVYTSRGADILFVLDTSPSMAAKDINGTTRISSSISTIEKIVRANSGASYGLVLMGSESCVYVPVTNDIETFVNRLKTVKVASMGDGTAIGTGISLAVYHIKTTLAKRKCIVLLTDGENNSGQIHPETAATLAKKNGIALYTIGVGTTGTVPIEYVNPETGELYSGYLESNFDSTQLEQIAVNSDGRYYSVETLSSLNMALSSIIKRQDVVQSYYIKTIDEHYYDKFLLVSLICFVIAWCIKRLYLKEFF